jgi:CheY-like chemotaxis protein
MGKEGRVMSPVKSREFVRTEEALERFRADASWFDLVVIDHALPGMSGLCLWNELLQR